MQTSVYDGDNNLVEREQTGDGATLVVDFTYTPDNQISTETSYSNLAGTTKIGATDYLYDKDGNVTSEVSTNGSGTDLVAFTYTYDPGDRVTAQTRTDYTGGVGSSTTTSYTYDGDSELTSAGGVTETYDANGNRDGSGSVVGAGNEIITDGTYTYAYDAEGDRIGKSDASGDSWTYAYDNAGQLTQVRQFLDNNLVSEVDYEYDVYGNLLVRTAWQPDVLGDLQVVDEEEFGYDGWKTNLDSQGDAPSYTGQENWDAWAVLNSSSTLTTRTIFGNSIDFTIGEFAPVTDGPTAESLYITDYQGSIVALESASGSIQGRIVYNGFGVETSNTIAGGEFSPGFQGQEFDNLTNLGYANARWTDPNTGAFTSMDRTGFASGTTNLDAFAGDDPRNASDPSGNELIAVGEQARDEALWQLQKTYGLDKNSILVQELGKAKEGVWESDTNGGGLPLYLIAPKASISNAANNRPILPKEEADAAIREMWQAYWNPNMHRFVGEVSEAKGAPDGNSWPGKFHTNQNTGAREFYIGTEFDRETLLTDEQRATANSVAQTNGQALDLSNIPVQTMWELAKSGTAEKFGDAYVIKLPELKQILVAAPITRLQFAGRTMSRHTIGYKVVGMARDSFDKKTLADLGYNDAEKIGALEGADNTLTFFLHVLPGGTASDYLANGQGTWKDAAIGTAGDLAMIASLGGSKLVAVSGELAAQGLNAADKIRRIGIGAQITGMALEGGVIAVRGAELAQEIGGDANGRKIAALSGEIVLRLVGVGAGAKRLVPVLRTQFRVPNTLNIVPGGGLAAHEGGALGGHTIKEHVRKTRSQLEARLASVTNVTAASSFPDLATAEQAIAENLAANTAKINTWLASGSSKPLPVTTSLGYNVGYGIPRGASGGAITDGMINMQSVLTVLKRDSSSSLCYQIFTSYPVPKP